MSATSAPTGVVINVLEVMTSPKQYQGSAASTGLMRRRFMASSGAAGRVSRQSYKGPMGYQ